jgi:polyisoprenyl-phosphate glycosyltransferase
MRELSLLSVVTPMYDEESSVRALYGRVVAALEDVPFELVVVDDGSRDGTLEILRELADRDERVKVVSLSRNFGHQPALTAGLDHARGDAVVMIDADLQDPPELIRDMVERWREGADVVYAVRRERSGETRFKLAAARLFYRVFARLATVELTPDSGDYRLMDRRVLDVLATMPERNRFLRGMTVWVGFTQTAILYDRDPRHSGVTKYPLRKMLRFSFDAVSSFSQVPLQLATLLGFVFSGVAFFIGVPLVVLARIVEIFDPGTPTIITVVLLMAGVQLVTLGIIGEYVGRIYDEVKRRPLYVVRDRHNVSEEPPPADRRLR